MDPEQTFIRVQERFSQMLTPRIRTALEYIYLILGIALFCLLVVMHANYVQQPGCSSELSVVETTEAQLVHIKITTMLHSHNEAESDVMNFPERYPSTENVEVSTVEGFGLTVLGAKFWLNWIGSGARRSKLVLKSLKTDDEYLESQADTFADSSSTTVSDEKVTGVALDESPISFLISATESLKAAVDHFYSKWKMRFSVFSGHIHSMGDTIKNVSGMNMLTDIPKWLHGFRLDGINLFAVEWLEKRGRSFEPTYLYTVEKGYFLLPEGAKSRHGIHTVNISISARDSCFGNRWQQLLINRFVGYDTILMNSLLSSPGQGYLYNYQTKEFFDLSYAHEPTEGSTRFGDYLVTKCGVLIMSLFVFFTTTMSVSFTLRETQARMLKFTVQLEHHARHRLPTFQLIFVHVIESLVFVPIMIGILFFLFEFYDDQLLAFMVLILVWLSELFTLIRRLGVARDYIDYGKISRIGSKSVRTSISMKFFPRFFLLYFLVFHIYFFSYPYGFSYLAFAATALFMQHLILYFWNRFEVPALQRFMQNRRSPFQQQPDIHITSSTILASTLHITRLNMRSPATSGNVASTPGTRLGGDQVWLPNVAVEAPDVRAPSETSPANSRDSVHEPSDTQPAETPSNPGSMNSFSSLLLWLLGGASSESLNSFLSLFRDVRHQSQVYPEPLPQENLAT